MEFIYRTIGKKAKVSEQAISRNHAEHLLIGHCRNTHEAILSLQNNSFAQLICEGGTIYARPANLNNQLTKGQ